MDMAVDGFRTPGDGVPGSVPTRGRMGVQMLRGATFAGIVGSDG